MDNKSIAPAKKPVKSKSVKKTTANEVKVNSVYAKLLAIMAECEFIEKDKENKHHGYKYASEEAIKKHIHPLLVREKLLFKVDIVDQERTENLTQAIFRYEFIDTVTGDSVDGTFCGYGSDNQDKGIWKALTGAIKYILTSTFLIPTGDDPEASSVDSTPTPTRSSRPAPASGRSYPMSEKQSKFLKDLMTERGLGGLWLKEQGVTGTPNSAQCKELIEKLLAMPAKEASTGGYPEEQPAPPETKTVEYPEDEINPEDIPF